ncbi:MAG: hypothetical protein ACI8RZ_001861 [Myxococcota bacterium]|jgi:hypothetical protein
MLYRWIGLIGLTGCAFEPLSGERLCEEVGFGIASQIHTCTADEELAQTGYEALYETHTCTIASFEDLSIEPSADPGWFACPAAMLTPACDTIQATEPVWWLALDESCAALWAPLSANTASVTDTQHPEGSR